MADPRVRLRQGPRRDVDWLEDPFGTVACVNNPNTPSPAIDAHRSPT